MRWGAATGRAGSRIGTFLGYFLYKNIAFSMTLFWFCLLNGFSAQALFDSSYQVSPPTHPRIHP